MNQLIPKTINFNELVKNSKTTLSLDLQTKLVENLNHEFTEQEQQWFIANLFVYINYHPTNDYPINLEQVYKMLGFANKGNAMKTIKSNFTLDEDYKVLPFRTEKQVSNLKNGKNIGGAGLNKESVMLNIDTFKNLCMLVKTVKGKEIRKYYVKLENLYNKLIKEEIDNQQKQLLREKEQNSILNKRIDQVQSELNNYKEKDYEQVQCTGFVYVISTDKPGVYKIGRTKNIKNRTSKLQTSLVDDIQIVFQFPTSNDRLLEDVVHYVLDRYRTNSNREHFRVDKEYIIKMLKIIGNTIDTSKSCCHNIEHCKLITLVTENLLRDPTPQCLASIPQNVYVEEVIEQQYNNTDDYNDEFVTDEDFRDWLDNSIEYSEKKCVIKLIDMVNLYTDDYSFSKFNSQIMAYYKTQFQEYVRIKYPKLRSFQHTIRYNGKTYKGWSHLRFSHS